MSQHCSTEFVLVWFSLKWSCSIADVQIGLNPESRSDRLIFAGQKPRGSQGRQIGTCNHPRSPFSSRYIESKPFECLRSGQSTHEGQLLRAPRFILAHPCLALLFGAPRAACDGDMFGAL